MQIQPAHNKSQATLTFKVLRVILQAILRLIFKIEITDSKGNKGYFPQKGGYILAANHLSWLDPFVLLAFAPASPRIYFVADKKNMVTNAFRRFMTGKIGGVILVEPNRAGGALNRELLEGVKEVLAGGGVFGIFPEGWVPELETGELLPFKKGLGYFAATNHAPILPVAISGTKELFFRKRVQLVIAEMVAVEPFLANGTGKATAEAITKKVEIIITETLPEPPVFNPAGLKLGRNFLTNLFASDKVPPIVRMEKAYRERQESGVRSQNIEFRGQHSECNYSPQRTQGNTEVFNYQGFRLVCHPERSRKV